MQAMQDTETSGTPINVDAKAIIEKAGGRYAVADATGVTYQAVQQWEQTMVPARRAVLVASMAGMKPEDVRPDVFYRVAE